MKSVKASAQCAFIYWALVIHTVKLETDELPHFGSDSQIPLDTEMREMSTVRQSLRVQRKWSHYTDDCDSILGFSWIVEIVIVSVSIEAHGKLGTRDALLLLVR